MIKKISYIILLLLGVFLINSCEKNANIKLPESEPQLVVAGFVSPSNDTVRLRLSWTVPIYNNIGYKESTFEPNAEVIIESGSNSYRLSYDTAGAFYIGENCSFNVGDKVDLSIKYKDSPVLRGKCILPEKPAYKIKNNGKKIIDYGDYTDEYYDLEFTSLNTSPTNYYQINFLGYFSDIYGNSYTQELYVSGGNLFEIDKNSAVNINVYYGSGSEESLDSVRAYIINASEDYYKYHKSVSDYQGDDLFIEPSIIFNNIENGIGNFSGYNMVSDTLMLK